MTKITIFTFSLLEEIYEDLGDTLAVQYGGSQLVHRYMLYVSSTYYMGVDIGCGHWVWTVGVDIGCGLLAVVVFVDLTVCDGLPTYVYAFFILNMM